MRRVWTFLVSVLALLLLLPCVAAAGHGERTVEFDTLEGSVRSGQLTLVYKIDRRDWKRLDRKGVRPTLNLWLAPSGEGDASFSYSQQIRRRKGSFTYPKSVALRNGDRVELELLGFHKDWRIEAVSYDDQAGPWASFTVADDHLVTGYTDSGDGSKDEPEPTADQAEEPDPRWRIEVIKACKEAFYRTKVDKCVQKATRLDPRWAAGIVEACDDAFSSSSYLDKCIDKARGHNFDPADTIAACDEAFASSSNNLECLSKTADYNTAPAPVVRACDEAAYSSSKRKACLDAARGLGDSAAELVEACDGSKVAACIKSASGGR